MPSVSLSHTNTSGMLWELSIWSESAVLPTERGKKKRGVGTQCNKKKIAIHGVKQSNGWEKAVFHLTEELGCGSHDLLFTHLPIPHLSPHCSTPPHDNFTLHLSDHLSIHHSTDSASTVQSSMFEANRMTLSIKSLTCKGLRVPLTTAWHWSEQRHTWAQGDEWCWNGDWEVQIILLASSTQGHWTENWSAISLKKKLRMIS